LPPIVALAASLVADHFGRRNVYLAETMHFNPTPLCFAAGLGLIATVATPSIFAQSPASGTVQGRIYNPTREEYVRNAEVRIEGTNRLDYSENDGSFRFNNVPSGPVTIVVNHTGYQSVRDTFTISGGQSVNREINLASTAGSAGSVVTLQAFTVSTEREGNAKAIMEQRRDMDITTSVSSDIFGDVTDGNVGEFLKYLPGVDLDYVESEARGPRLGGMDSQYVGVSFDGIRTASADANRGGGENSRATSFEGFAIASIDSIEISRTTSAESDADSPAGTINMKTRRAFDREGRSLSYNASVNFNADEFTLAKTPGPSDNPEYKWKPNLGLQYSDVLLNQRLGVLLGVSRANSFTEQYRLAVDYNRSPTASDPRPMVARQIDFKDGPKFILKDAMTLTMDFKATPNLTLSFTGIYTYTEGEFWNRNFTFVAGTNNNNVNRGRSRVGGDGILTVSTNRAGNNPEPRLSNGGGSSSKLTYTRTFAPKFEYKLGDWLFDGAFTFSKSVNDYEALERGFTEAEGGAVPSDWVATRPHPTSWEWTVRQTSGPDWFNYANFVDTNTRSGGTRVENSGRRWITEIWNGQLNARWTLPFMERFPTTLKVGGKWNEESRDNSHYDDWWIWSYIGPGGNTVARAANGAFVNTSFGHWANLGYISPHPFDMGTTNGLTVFNITGQQGMPPRGDRNKISDLFHARPDLFVHVANPDNYYNNFVVRRRDFRQTVIAGYMQADVRLTPKLTLRTGLRLENTLNENTEFDPRTRAEVIAAGHPVNGDGRATTFAGIDYQFFTKPRIVRESEYHNYFPSVLAKYRFTPNLEWQAGFNKAISRPPIDSLSGVWLVDEDASPEPRVTLPNPQLEPEHSKNYQTRLAYYFGGRSPGQFSVGFAQNDIRNLRETFDFTAEDFGIADPYYSSFVFRSTRNSAEVRRFRSMEVVYNQTMGFLPGRLQGLNYNVAYTRVYASQRRPNLAPHIVTSRLGYSYRRFNGFVGMKWRDDSPDGSVYGRYKRELTQFDLGLTYKINNRLSFYAQGRNITGKPVLWYESPPGFAEGDNPALRAFEEYGANWTFGIKGTF
jgi:iron complex outermembrane receptor protein